MKKTSVVLAEPSYARAKKLGLMGERQIAFANEELMLTWRASLGELQELLLSQGCMQSLDQPDH
jgi:hypothetical protein